MNSVSDLESCAKQNIEVEIDYDDPAGKVLYMASKDIMVGDELFISYGRDYFKLAEPRMVASAKSCTRAALHEWG